MAEDKTKNDNKVVTQNKKATFDFFIEKRFEAGLVLKGSEVKSLRNGKVQLVDSFAMVEKGELFLHKAHISEYAQSGPYFNHLATRKRKLLLHKREIAELQARIEQEGYTLIPLSIYFKKGKAKLELGLAKGKSKGDKRATIKDREEVRQMDKARKRGRDDD